MRSRNQKTSDDVARLRNGLNIRRPRKKSNMLNNNRIKSCIGSPRALQFLQAVQHSVGAHTDTLQPRNDSSSSEDDDEDDVSQAPAPAATTSAASESVVVPAAATSDDSCQV